MVATEDVKRIAKELNLNCSDEQAVQIVNEYPDAQEQDPTGNWTLVIENQLYQLG